MCFLYMSTKFILYGAYSTVYLKKVVRIQEYNLDIERTLVHYANLQIKPF